MRKDTLRRFWAMYLLELRLTCLHWSYLIFLVLWSAFIISNYVSDDFAFVGPLFNFVMGFSSLIALFMTGLQATRVSRNRFDALDMALPSGVEVLFARWFASITAVSGLLIAPLFLVVVLPAGRSDVETVARSLGLTFLSTSFATGLIWLCQNTLGIRRWMYPFFAVFWIAGGLVPGTLSNDGLPVPGVNLLNFITMNQAGISLWGLLPQGQLPTLITLFYVGLVALFASVILWRTLAVRFYRRSTVALWMIALASAIVLVTAGSYSVQVSAANQQVLDEDRYRNDRFEVIKLPRDMPFAVTAYDLTFAPGAPARLSATMQIVNRSNATIRELLFSLYRQFDIIEASVPFTRQDGTFTLTLPEAIEPSQSARVRVNYEGNIQYLERRLGRPPEATYFIHPNGVNLACPLLWYPVPGSVLPNTTYYDEYFVGHPHCLLDTPSRMRLTVHGSSSLQYVSNLTQVSPAVFESAGATWAQLIGAAELQTISSEAVTVVAAGPQTAEIASLVTEYYPPAFEHIRRFFPEAAHLTVFALNLGADSFSQWDDYPATAEGAIVVIDPRYLPWLRANPQNEYDFVGRPMVSSILGQGTTLAENIASFLWIHYRANGDNAAMRTMLENGLPAGERGRVTYYSVPYRERYQIAFALFDMYEAHGEAGIIDLIAKIRANLEALNGLPPEQVVAWIEEAANAD